MRRGGCLATMRWLLLFVFLSPGAFADWDRIRVWVEAVRFRGNFVHEVERPRDLDKEVSVSKLIEPIVLGLRGLDQVQWTPQLKELAGLVREVLEPYVGMSFRFNDHAVDLRLPALRTLLRLDKAYGAGNMSRKDLVLKTEEDFRRLVGVLMTWRRDESWNAIFAGVDRTVEAIGAPTPAMVEALLAPVAWNHPAKWVHDMVVHAWVLELRYPGCAWTASIASRRLLVQWLSEVTLAEKTAADPDFSDTVLAYLATAIQWLSDEDVTLGTRKVVAAVDLTRKYAARVRGITCQMQVVASPPASRDRDIEEWAE